jgi:hypothetical protein
MDWQRELDMIHLAGSHPHIIGLVGTVVCEAGDDRPVGLIFKLHGASLSDLLDTLE